LDLPVALAGSGPTLSGRESPARLPVPAARGKVGRRRFSVHPKRWLLLAKDREVSRETVFGSLARSVEEARASGRMAGTPRRGRIGSRDRAGEVLRAGAQRREHLAADSARDARSPEGVRLSPHPLGALSQDSFRHLDVPSASACTATVGWLGSFVLRFDPSPVGRCPSVHSPRAPPEHHPALRRSGMTRRDLGGPDGHWHPSPRSEIPFRGCDRNRSPGDPSDPSLQRSPLASPVGPEGPPSGSSPGRSRSSEWEPT